MKKYKEFAIEKVESMLTPWNQDDPFAERARGNGGETTSNGHAAFQTKHYSQPVRHGNNEYRTDEEASYKLLRQLSELPFKN